MEVIERPKIKDYGKESIGSHIKLILKKIQDNNSILVATGEQNVNKNIKLILRSISSQMPIIYVSLRETPEQINEYYKDMNPSRLFYIGATFSDESLKLKRTKLINKVSDLNSISIAIKNWESEIKGNKILIFDSLSTLFVYNKSETSLKFIHMLLSELSSETKSIFITTSENLEKAKELYTFFNEVIKL